jgi:hypothetical protein
MSRNTFTAVLILLPLASLAASSWVYQTALVTPPAPVVDAASEAPPEPPIEVAGDSLDRLPLRPPE